jgi:hypothetical protein
MEALKGFFMGLNVRYLVVCVRIAESRGSYPNSA